MLFVILKWTGGAVGFYFLIASHEKEEYSNAHALLAFLQTFRFPESVSFVESGTLWPDI